MPYKDIIKRREASKKCHAKYKEKYNRDQLKWAKENYEEFIGRKIE